ncbi:MAG: ATP-dependent helicase HrpB [Planctomycetes bacterium]|nr:ATP-dependent helicase HrpB [Planctomycetota bacterium]
MPIDRALPQLVAALREHRCGVVTAPPGSGKTTRVPPALVDSGLVDGEVWVLQPRRLAARASARRVAQERGGRVGGEVGYQVRHDKAVSAATRIRFVTEGILVRQLVRDPFLPGVGAVVLDEFHERSLESDLALAMLAEVRATVRDDLLLVVMSATLDADPVVEFLAPCPRIDAEGQAFAVDVEYLAERGNGPAGVRAAVSRALTDTPGDVLVFLPGVGEIHACADELHGAPSLRGVDVLPLHGSLTPEQQDQAIAVGPRRRVVLATNVAETSITIAGVTAVVDSGLARTLRHDPSRGLDRLELTHISRASAEQRRGRAGRTAPGVCYRLWSKAEDRGLAAFDLPEIRRLDLAGLALQVRAFARRDPAEFGWFEPPDEAALRAADDLLQLLGAVRDGAVTALGEAMLRYPLHPRLARMMEEGRRRGMERSAAELAALLAERDLQRGAQAAADPFAQCALLHELEQSGFRAGVARGLDVDTRAARAVAKARDQLARGATDRVEPDAAALVKTMLAGFPDRVSFRDSALSADGVMASGRGCRLTMTDHENLGPLFLVLRVRDASTQKQPRALVSLACALQEEWLEEVFPGSLRDEERVELDAVRGAVVVRHRRCFGNLVLEQRVGGRPDPEQAAELLEAELRRDLWRHLGDQPELRELLARLAFVRRASPDSGIPDLGDAEVADAAAAACVGLTRLADVARAPIHDALLDALPGDARARLTRDAPVRVTLPSGRQAKVDYTSGPEPFVAARLQEFFGATTGPRLCSGRVPLLLHLLAPNHRPIQITSDLGSFWAQVYPRERGALRRRYPKHAWPDDPLTAAPESRPRRR